MKTIRKYVTVLVILAVVTLLVYKLFSNKKELDNELKAMSEYSSVIPVEVIAPKIRECVQTIEENGVMRSGAEIDLLSETSGQITYVSGNVGEQVSTGQTLVRVEKEVIESQFKLAKVSLENAEKNLERYENLVGGDAITKQQLEASKLNYQNALTNFTGLKKQLENTEIKSPVNGVIAKRFVEAGDNLMPSMQVFSILESNNMVFVVRITEEDIQRIKKGQEANISLDIVKEKTFPGKVQSIGVTPDMAGRYEVKLSIADHDNLLRSGLSGKALFKNTSSDEGIVIPRKCIIGSINDATVFILQGDSVVSRSVQAVTVNESDALITEGLSSGEKVVLSGQINLQDGTKVRVLNHKN